MIQRSCPVDGKLVIVLIADYRNTGTICHCIEGEGKSCSKGQRYRCLFQIGEDKIV